MCTKLLVLKKNTKKYIVIKIVYFEWEMFCVLQGSEEEAGARRPFSRDIDLKVNRFDEAQKKAIFKKAQLLDDRFSAGQSKFL